MEMSKNFDSQFYNTYYNSKDYCDMSDFKITDGLLVKGKKILSLGCGTCNDIYYLLKENEVWGVDFSQEAIDVALRLGVKAKKADLEERLDFPDYYFDIVICKDVIEHLLKPDNLLRQIHRILKNDGFLILNVPNHFYWYFRLRILFGSNLIWRTFFHDHTKYFEEWNYMHIRFFTYKGFLKLLGICGFKVQKAFWDFGMLAHYADPERLTQDFRKKLLDIKESVPVWKKIVITKILSPLYWIFDFFFPRKIRSRIVSLNPALLSASFYLRCIKSL